MKQVLKQNMLNVFLCCFLVSIFDFVSFCQENINTTKLGPPDEEEKWYSQPWVWIVGAVLLILLLITVLKRTKPTRSIADEERLSKVVGTEDNPDSELDR